MRTLGGVLLVLAVSVACFAVIFGVTCGALVAAGALFGDAGQIAVLVLFLAPFWAVFVRSGWR